MSFSDAGLRALFKLSTEEYDGDLYAENLVGIPLLARSGSDDETVPRTYHMIPTCASDYSPQLT